MSKRELISVQQRVGLAVAAALLSVTAGRASAAIPSNPQVVAQSANGQTTFNTTSGTNAGNPGLTLTVNSSASRVVIDWDSFDIAASNAVEFIFDQGGRAIAVNRVCVSGQSCSPGIPVFINGALRSNGNVWILASGGVYFSATAKVDVAGLLVTPANLDSVNDFISGPVDAPIAFTMPLFPGSVVVDPGAVIVTRGGAAMLVAGGAGVQSGSSSFGSGRGLKVAGSVGAPSSNVGAGLDPDAPGGQVLYGAAGKFRLVMKERAPDSLSSGDLELFDFIIDEGYAVDSSSSSFSSGFFDSYTDDAILIEAGSETRASQVIIKAKKGTDPNPPSSNPTPIPGPDGKGVRIRGSVDATGADRTGPLAASLLIDAAGDLDVILDRTVSGFGNFSSPSNSSPGSTIPVSDLAPLVELKSAGSTEIKGRDVLVYKRQADNSSQTLIADHQTAALQSTGPANITASRDVVLQEVKLNGANVTAGGQILLKHSLIDPLAGNLKANGLVRVAEMVLADGTPTAADFALTMGNIEGGEVDVAGRGDVTTGNVNSTGLVNVRSLQKNLRTGNVAAGTSVNLLGETGLTVGAVDAGDFAQLRSAQGSIVAGSVTSSQKQVDLEAGTTINSGTLTAKLDVEVTATGAITTGNILSTDGRAFVRGQALALGNVVSKNEVNLGSTGGTLSTGDLTSNGSGVEALSTGNMSLGNVTAVGLINLREGNPNGGLAPQPINVVAGALDGREVNVEVRGQAQLGAIKSQSRLFVGAIQGMSLQSAEAGTIGLQSDEGGISVGVTAAAGGFTGGKLLSRSGETLANAKGVIRTGEIDSAGIVRIGSIDESVTTGAVTADLSVELRGPKGVTAGLINAQKFVRLEATAGSITTGAVTATEEKIDLDASGTVTSGALSAGLEVEVNASGNITLAAARGKRVDVASSAGAIAIEGATLSTAESVRLVAETGITTGSIESATLVDAQSKTGTVKTAAVEAKSGTVLLQGGSVESGNVTATGNVDLLASAGTVTGGALKSTGAAVRAIGTQAVTTGAVDAASDLLLESKNASVTSGALTATGVAQVRSAQTATLASIRGRNVDVASSAGAIAIEGATVSTAESVRLLAETGITTGSIESATLVDAQSKTGTVKTAAVEAKSGTVLLQGGSVESGNVTATGTIEIASTQGAVTLAAVRSTESAVRVRADGALTVGNISAKAFADLASAKGDVTAGDIASRDVRLKSSAGDVSVKAVTASSLVVEALGGEAGEGDVLLEGAIVLRRPEGVTASADEPISLDVNAKRDVTVSAAVSSDRELKFTAGRRFTNTARIETVGTDQVGDIEIYATDVAIDAPIFIPGGSVVFHATGSGGIVLGNGLTAGDSTLALSNEEVSRLEVEALGLHAGAGDTKDADIVVGDLTLDGDRIARTILATESGGEVRIRGRVEGRNAPGFEVGFEDLIPDAIEITGALGTRESPMGQLRLRAAKDILIGSQAFIDEIRKVEDPVTFDLRAISAQFGGVTANQLFVVSGPAQFVATRAVLQQNTGGVDGAGIRIGAATGELGSTFGAETAPQRIAVFGAVVGSDGVVREGVDVVNVSNLVPAGTESSSRREFNDCVIGGGACSRGGTDIVQAVTASTPVTTQAPPAASDPPPAGNAEPAPAQPASSEPAPNSESPPTSEPASDSEPQESPEPEATSEPSSEPSSTEEGSGQDESSQEDSSQEESSQEESSQEESNEEESEEEQSEEESATEDDVVAEEEAANDEEEEAAEDAVAEVAAAETEDTEEDLRPLEIDPGSRDLLNSQGGGEVRDPGVGTANEDLWPQGAPPQPGVSP